MNETYFCCQQSKKITTFEQDSVAWDRSTVSIGMSMWWTNTNNNKDNKDNKWFLVFSETKHSEWVACLHGSRDMKTTTLVAVLYSSLFIYIKSNICH